MTDRAEWLADDGRLLADVIRKLADSEVITRVEQEIVAPWRAAYADDPTSPPPPEISLAVNPFWWNSINAATKEIEDLAPELDPIGRLTVAAMGYAGRLTVADNDAPNHFTIVKTDLRIAERQSWAVNQIRAIRSETLRQAACRLFDVLAAGEVRLVGIREPALAHGGVPQDLPAAALRSLQWRLTAESAVISLPIGTGDSIAFSNARLTIVVMNEPELPANSRKRNKGGRPPRPDREIFNVEVTRRLSLDSGHLTIRELRIGMKQWAEDNLNPAPDGRSVERWINEMVSPDLLPG